MKKTLAVALLAIIAVSSLSFAVVSANAMGMANRGWGWNIGAWMKNGALIPFQRSCVRLNGVVDTLKIGSVDQEVTGSLSINARTVSAEENVIKKANATALWRTSEDKNTKEEDSWTYSFYAARLVSAETSALGTEEDAFDYQLIGKWNIVHVTVTHTVTKTGDEATGYTIDRQTRTTVEPIATGKTGTLIVTGGWTDFVLSITGEKTYELSGKISRTRMTQMDFNKFKLSEDNTDVVSRVDLKVLAKNYGARPGWGSYDSNMDFNCNYKIDIADLVTVAANVQSS
jgi:hypothetical protein